MPQLGESVAEGTVTKWLVRAGDFVKREQPLVEVATDKADTEIPSPASGRVAELTVTEGTVVAKGTVICRIDESATEGATQRPEASAAPPGGNGGRPLTSPATRMLARNEGVDLERVQATGEHGRITRDDVLRAAGPEAAPSRSVGPTQTPAAPISVRQPQPISVRSIPEPMSSAPPRGDELSRMVMEGGGFVPPIPGVGYGAYKVPQYTPKPGDEVVPFTRRRRITADHMVYSKAASAHVVTVAEIDLQATSRMREEHKAQLKKEGVSLTFLAFVCAAAVKALREFPHVNARVLENSYVVLKDIHLGVAVDTPGGLIVPSIKNADRMSLRGLASTIDDLASRARAGKITADDLAGTTFSISNPGLKGNLFGASIISQPNVAILRMGEIKKRVVVVTNDGEDSMAIHPVMFMALSYDHRVIDGVLANSFLWRISEILGKGEFEL